MSSASETKDETNAVNTAGAQICEELQLTTADQPNLLLTTKVLDGSNWSAWRRAVERALYVKNKICFIDGTSLDPSPLDPNYKQWKRVDSLVLTWLRNTINPEIDSQFEHHETSLSLWNELKECYGKVSGTQILMLRRKIANFIQGDKSVTSYYSALKKMWNDYRSLKPFPTHSVESLKDLLNSDEEDLMIQFLMGLNDEYSHICNQILIMNPLPSVTIVFGMICNCESQKGLFGSNGVENGNSFVLASVEKFEKGSESGDKGNNEKKGSITCSYFKRIGHSRDKCYQLANKNAYCHFCKKSGHSRANCFQISGVVPEWYKALVDRKKNKSVVGAAISTGPEITTNTNGNNNETALSAPDKRISRLEETIRELTRSHLGANLSTPVEYVGSTHEPAGPYL